MASPPGVVNIAAVNARTPLDLIAVGGTDGLFGSLVVATSSDAGRHWSVTSPAAPALTSVTSVGDRLFGGAECTAETHTDPRTSQVRTSTLGDCLFESADNGATWRALPHGRITDPSFATAMSGWAHSPLTDSAGSLLVTDDGGSTWSKGTSPCPSNQPVIHSAVNTEVHAGYVLCAAEPTQLAIPPWTLIRVEANGRTSKLASGDASTTGGFAQVNAAGFVMNANGRGFLATNVGLFSTTDAGASWEKVNGTDGNFTGQGIVLADGTAYLPSVESGVKTGIRGTRDGMSWTDLIAWPYFGGSPTVGSSP
jgi:hypothetical protein